MAEQSPRFGLPLLQAGQAQKEAMHNEAIVALECLAQSIVETIGDVVPPADPAMGASWIVGAGASGAWLGQGGTLATWTDGGWRFVTPIAGTAAFVKASGLTMRYTGAGWNDGAIVASGLVVGGHRVIAAQQPAIADPAGGGVIDAPARAAIAAILAALRTHGLVAG